MKYRVHKELLTKKEWIEEVEGFLDKLLEYQELDDLAEGENGKEYRLCFERKFYIEEQ